MKVEERFLKYVAVNTQSNTDSTACPSTPCQLDLVPVLMADMNEIGLADVQTDGTGYVYGLLPASEGCEDVTPMGLVAHMDTHECVSGADIKTSVIEYKGGDIQLANGKVTDLKTFPNLNLYVGQHLIITDGNTLLGSDDKAGIAEILAATEYFIAHPEIKHGPIYVMFNPDEETGRGMERVNLDNFKAKYAYTVDGATLGELEYETFNAAVARIKFNGVSVHPGSSKNKMRNAILMLNDFLNMLPAAEAPAHTENYEGFYHVNTISGRESEANLKMIIRDHDRAKFEARKQYTVNVCEYLNKKYGEGTVELDLKDQYYNMREKLEDKLWIVDRAKAAFEKFDIVPVTKPIRGGTDGSALSFMGLPTPNLSTGGENCHGCHEFISIEAMNKMVEVLVEVAKAQ